jgi:hypothetical protein
MSDIVLQDQGEPTGLSSDETAIYPNTSDGTLYKKKGSDTPVSIEYSATAVLNTLLTGLSLLTGTPITAVDTILIAFGKLQKQINDLNFSKVIRTDYLEGTTVDPSTTATTSGTATILAEMTDTFTPTEADDVIDVFFGGTFGESFTGKDETVHIGIFIDGSLVGTTERSQTVKGILDSDKISSVSTQWSGSLSAVPHTIDIRFWVNGGAGATVVAIGTRRNLIIKETDE